MTKHFCRARTETYPLWGPWPKEPGDPLFLCACGHIGRDDTVLREPSYTDCRGCADAMRAWLVEYNAKRCASVMDEAGPGWEYAPKVYRSGAVTPRIRCGAVTAVRTDSWSVEVCVGDALNKGTGPTLASALSDARHHAKRSLDAELQRVACVRQAVEAVDRLLHEGRLVQAPNPEEAP